MDGKYSNQNAILSGAMRCFTDDDVMFGVMSKYVSDVILYAGQ